MLGWLSGKLCPRRNVSTFSKVFTAQSGDTLRGILSSLQAGKDIESLTQQFDAIRCRPFANQSCFPKKIGYLPLEEVQDLYNLCIFYLPLGASLPYHNHPNQHVLLKVVFGEVEISSFDVNTSGSEIEPGNICSIVDGSRKCTLVSVNDTSQIVRPNKDNIHKITAQNGPALFIDLVVPPYSWQRNIVYFEETGEGTVRALRERDVPIDMDLVYPEQFFHNK